MDALFFLAFQRMNQSAIYWYYAAEFVVFLGLASCVLYWIDCYCLAAFAEAHRRDVAHAKKKYYAINQSIP